MSLLRCVELQNLSTEGKERLKIRAGESKYRYNNKELNQDFGLDWYDYGARWYDAAIGRWGQLDPLITNYYPFSGYSYVINNPVLFVDPKGMDLYIANNDYFEMALSNIISLVNNSKFEGKVTIDITDTQKGAKVDVDFGDLSKDDIEDDKGLFLLKRLTSSHLDYLYEINTEARSINRKTLKESKPYKLGSPAPKHKGSAVVNLSINDRLDKPPYDIQKSRDNHAVFNGLPMNGFHGHVIISPFAGESTTGDGRAVPMGWFTFHELLESYNRTNLEQGYDPAHANSKLEGESFYLTPSGWNQNPKFPYELNYTSRQIDQMYYIEHGKKRKN